MTSAEEIQSLLRKPVTSKLESTAELILELGMLKGVSFLDPFAGESFLAFACD